MKTTPFLIAPQRWMAGQPLANAIVRHGVAVLNETRESYPNWRPDLYAAVLDGENLAGANLTNALLNKTSLSKTNLTGAQLNFAQLAWANLNEAWLNKAQLLDAKLYFANLGGAIFSGATLTGAELKGAQIGGANFSGAVGLLSPSLWMMDNFESVDGGYIVYKAQFGPYPSPDHWEWRPGAILTETVNRDPTYKGGCGVNFGALHTLHFTVGQYGSAVWRCLIEREYLPSIVVPYNTEGYARCERLKLLEYIGSKP